MIPVTRDDTVPAPSDLLWVLKLKAMERDTFTCYSPKFQGIWSHWNGKKTTPCYANHDYCYKGHEEASLRWYGYLHGWSKKYHRQCFLEVPAQSAHNLMSMFRVGHNFRGLSFEVCRGKSPKGPILFEWLNNLTREKAELPTVRDCVLSVLRFWQVDPANPIISAHAIDSLDQLPLVQAG